MSESTSFVAWRSYCPQQKPAKSKFESAQLLCSSIVRIELMLTHSPIQTFLETLTKCEPWSIVTERRRLSWLGHLMRLNPQTPAQTISQRSTKTSEEEARQTPNDIYYINNSKSIFLSRLLCNDVCITIYI